MENINELIEYNLNFIKNKSNLRIRRLELKNIDGNTLPMENCIPLYKTLLEKNLLFENEYNDLFLTVLSEEIILNGGWLNHLESEKLKAEKAESKDILEFENLKLQKESSEYTKTLRHKEEEIRALTASNLILQNRQLKRYILYSIISFISGAALTNLKDIIDLWRILTK